jgi:hypothetical protein
VALAAAAVVLTALVAETAVVELIVAALVVAETAVVELIAAVVLVALVVEATAVVALVVGVAVLSPQADNAKLLNNKNSTSSGIPDCLVCLTSSSCLVSNYTTKFYV